MRMRILVVVSALALLGAAAAGYRLGAGTWPTLGSDSRHAHVVAPTAEAQTERKVLYWQHPDGQADFSAQPKKTPDGRDYLPVYEDQEADFKAAKPAPAKKGDRKTLYYRNPMGLPDTSPVPKKDPMGMDYIPVYEGEDDDGSTVRVSLDRVQRAGVRTEVAEMRSLARLVRAPGVAKPDERALRSVTLRADGFIEELYVNETGKQVCAPANRCYASIARRW